jgi:hypothetical protein
VAVIRDHQRPSEAIRGHQRPSEAIRCHHGKHLEARLVSIRGHQKQSEAIRASTWKHVSSSETTRGNQMPSAHLEARLVSASVGRRHVRQVASHVDEQRRRHGCEFRQGRCPVMERPHEPRILMTEVISMQGRSSSAISGPSNWQSSALSGPSEAIKCTQWAIRGNQVHSVGHQRQSNALSGPSNRQSSTLTFHTTRWHCRLTQLGGNGPPFWLARWQR